MNQERVHTSGNKHVDSCKNDNPRNEHNVAIGGYNNDEEMTFTEAVSDGWEIKPGSTTNTPITAPNNGVNTKLTFISATKTEAVFKAETKHSTFGHSGIMDFCIQFTEWRDIRVKDQDFDIDVKIGWGERTHIYPTSKLGHMESCFSTL